MPRIVVSLWLLPAPGGARVSSRAMTAAEAALAGAIGIVPGTTSVLEVPDEPEPARQNEKAPDPETRGNGC